MITPKSKTLLTAAQLNWEKLIFLVVVVLIQGGLILGLIYLRPDASIGEVMLSVTGISATITGLLSLLKSQEAVEAVNGTMHELKLSSDKRSEELGVLKGTAAEVQRVADVKKEENT